MDWILCTSLIYFASVGVVSPLLTPPSLSRRTVLQSTENKTRAIQDLVAPHADPDVSFDATKSKRGVVTPFGEGGKISYSHGKALDKKIDRRKKNLKSYMVLEHQPELGPRSRFGDGDGTFWDRWMTTTGIKTKDGYKSTPFPDQSSFKQGSTMPRSGFKKYSSGGDFQKKLVDTGNKNRVRPYSLYSKQEIHSTVIRKPGQMQYSRPSLLPAKTQKKEKKIRESIKKETPFNYSLEELMASDDEGSDEDSFDSNSLISELSQERYLRESVNTLKKRPTFQSKQNTGRAMSHVTQTRMANRRQGGIQKKTIDTEVRAR